MYSQSSFETSRNRRDGSPIGGGSIDSNDHKRQRKRACSRDSSREPSVRKSRIITPLDSRILTPEVWIELFDIFQLHYSADFPFIHATTFLQPLRQSQAGKENADGHLQRPPGSDGFLLAFLALTARFHPGLVAAHARRDRDTDPLNASRYYAIAAEERLADYCRTGWGDLDQLQGLLMLGLHEFGMCKGRLAWTHIGLAIRSAQAMGLQYQADLDDAPLSRSRAIESHADIARAAPSPSKSETSLEQDRFVQQETRRRTFWSCFIMDRYVSSGKYRPQMLFAEELRIQLPASEQSFTFAERVQTLMLHEDMCEFNERMKQSKASISGDAVAGVRPELGPQEGLTSRYVRMVELFGKIAKWSCAGGRRNERYGPWDHRSEYHTLHRACLDFEADLPRHHTLNSQNTQAHISMKTSTPYVLMHAMYSLCQIVLNREYVPFVALACQEPVGPLDEPTFHPNDVPGDFWAGSAKECFKSARDIVDLVVTCRRWNAMVETPFMGFALYITSFVAVYCDAFPWMDTDKHMVDSSVVAAFGLGHEAVPRVQDIVQQMGLRLPMAAGWTQALGRMRKHYAQKRTEHNNIRRMSMPDDGRKGDAASVKKSGGGGLEEYKQMEHMLEFGQLSDGEPPLFELATSRESTTQTDKVLTPSPAASVRISKATEESIESTDGRSTTEPEEQNVQQLASAQARVPTPIQQLGAFRIPPIPHEKAAKSSSTSPTASTLSTLPSPGNMYQAAPYNTWPAYQQMAPNFVNNGMNPLLHQSALASTGPAYEPYPGPTAISTPATQYIPANPHMPVAAQIWPNAAVPIGNHQHMDPGVGGEDFCAFVQGNSLPDYAVRAGGQGQVTWLGELWTPGNDPQ